MTLLHPIWLCLLVPLALALWRWRLPSRLLLGLRALTLVLLLLALCGLSAKLPSRGGLVIVVADRSESMPADSSRAQKEAIELLHSGMRPEDRLAVVSFGRTAAVEQPPGTERFPDFQHEVGRDASNLAEGLERALALVPKETPARLLVLSDGRWTGRDPATVAYRAAARGVAIDYRLLERSTASDLAIERIDAPSEAAPGEWFLLTAWVHVPMAQTVSFTLYRGKDVVESGQRQLTTGRNHLTFRDRAVNPGSLSYVLTVESAPAGGADGPPTDPVPENNRARVLVGVRGPRPLLHVTRSASSGLAELLRAGGVPVKVMHPKDCHWTLEELAGCSAVLLENVPAEDIGTPGMETLAAWVRDTGGGLMMTGGRNSYAQGGYYGSPLASVMPVSMELRDKDRKLSLAIVVALDCSGSMTVPVEDGRPKMALANAGAAQVLDLLGATDELGVLAIDTRARVVADLAPVQNKPRTRNAILEVRAGGGGIYVYEALKSAVSLLRRSKSGNRHVLLFADASDAVQPGDYIRLLEECRREKITVSVIGLGSAHDKDAGLLRDVAARGLGSVFFTARPEDLPRLFAQDTFGVARSTFLEEVTPVEETPGLRALTGRQFRLSTKIGGYNLCYLRDGATQGTVTRDEYTAPVVAAWQVELGRVLCYLGEADGTYAGPIVRWRGVGDYFTSLARWTTGAAGDASDSFVVTQEVRKGLERVRLQLDPHRKDEPFAGQLPQLTVLRTRPGSHPRTEKTSLHWAGADELVAELPLRGEETALATVSIPDRRPLSLPPVCLPYSPEYAPDEDERGPRTLELLARATLGRERVELPVVWKELPRQVRLLPLAPYLLAAALLLLLLEVLERRTALLSKQGRLVLRLSRTATGAKGGLFERRPSVAAPPPPEPTMQLPKVPVAPAEKTGVVEAMRRVRERLRGRGET